MNPLLQQSSNTQECVQFIPTFCKDLDNLLGGGIRTSSVTEISGFNGAGKSVFCLQLCLSVQIPHSLLNGMESDAILITTEKTFTTKRLDEMIRHFINDCSKVSYLTSNNVAQNQITVESLSSKIHISKCRDVNELITTLEHTDQFVEKQGKIKLLIIDNIYFPFQECETDFKDRDVKIIRIGNLLTLLANKHNIAIVVVNKLKREKVAGYFTVEFIPYLGSTWSEFVSERIKFTRKNNNSNTSTNNNIACSAEIFKSATKRRGSVDFRITEKGIRGLFNFIYIWSKSR